MTPLPKKWQVYERAIASMLLTQIDTDRCITPNARVKGFISGRSRQLDVLIDARHHKGVHDRIIVDAKLRRRKVNLNDVEAFLGLMQDVEATRGYLVTPAGATRAAERRALDSISIALVPLERLDAFDPTTWPNCKQVRRCDGKVFWDGFPQITLVTRRNEVVGSNLIATKFVHYVGKCDRCGGFHVWCRTCDELLAPSERGTDIGHQCRCKLPWFWLASIEQDEAGRRYAGLHLCRIGKEPEMVDRRPL